ncbi:RagB/SusD family nutrient uptake outer membrane protein [Pedobacter sp. UBA4863]|uniref:RagB/SusD family nutrient uptake outer membrane protein n=1 Tax=Pedobacter sp. UBA4863 TaxID=1947060 RepID=UPI0025FDD283|nr:RagB/SusD family nutrient uptake outer membrane protein [Pedobacter sp. UBA4863]
MKKIILNTIGLLLLIMGVFSSCKKLVDIPDPIDTLTDEKVFKTDPQADQSIAALYLSMMSTSDFSFSFGYATLHGGLAADELTVLDPIINFEYYQVYKNDIQPENGKSFAELWTSAYKTIYIANAILDGEAASVSSQLTAKKREELKAHAKFIRAFCLFYLTGFYEKIPLTKSSKYNQLISLSKSSQEEVYQSISVDLEEAIQHYRAANLITSASKGSSFAAEALLARVYLYQKNWDKAKLHATNVINSGHYILDINLRNTFTKNSTEGIFNLKKDPTSLIDKFTDTHFLSPLIPFYAAFGDDPMIWDMFLTPDMYDDAFMGFFGTAPQIEVSQSLGGAFESNDKRGKVWLNYNPTPTYAPYTGRKVYFSDKYPAANVSPDTYNVMRLAEMYLIRAEANAHLDLVDLAKADLQVVRNRAGLTNAISLADKNAALEAVANERRFELFAEWGHRLFDLKRTGKALGVLSQNPDKVGINAKRIKFPIPSTEVARNPRLGGD